MSEAVPATLASRNLIASGIAEVVFALPSAERFPFRPGQFVSVSLADEPSGVHRSYSIASPPGSDRLRFFVRIRPPSASSEYLMSMPLGTEVRMTGPHGRFVLDPAHAADVVFAATGTGISPVLPMLDALVRRPEPGRRHLFWGLREEADLFAEAELRELCRRARTELHVHLTSPSPSWAGERGRISRAILDSLPRLELPIFYLVGNPAMITELKRELIARGVDRQRQIRTEAFID